MKVAVVAEARATVRSSFTRVELRRLGVDAVLGTTLGGVLSLLAFLTTGGVDLGPNTWAEIVLSLAGAGIGVAAAVRSAPRRGWGMGTLYLFAALTLLTVLSISWSVQPADSWVEANRAVSYLAAFGAALALARVAPERWPALVGALATMATVVCGYALLVKVFPGTFDPLDPLGRVNLPFNYWNAVGLVAAMGLPACLWAGARAERARALRSLAVPAIAILLTALVLSYSRSAVIAAVVGVGCWFAFVPLRLRAALVLALGATGAGGAVAWALATHPLTHDHAVLAARVIAGHGFGLVLALVLVLSTGAGFLAAFALDRTTLAAPLRRRVATVLLVLVALIPIAGIGAIAASPRGLTGEISHIWDEFTRPQASGVGDQAGRLLAVANSRGRYWSEGYQVGKHALLKGVGAGAFGTARRVYTDDPLDVQHAHSYVVETFADLGLLGVLVSLALLVAWALATMRAVGFTDSEGRRRSRSTPLSPARSAERAGLLTLLAVVITFGVQSAVDWTWFVPGAAVPALICAGWLAGRGPLAHPVGRARDRVRRLGTPAVGAALTALVAVLIIGAWAMLQPLRSQDADTAAITALSDGDTAAALADARTAANANPLSVDPLRTLSQIYQDLHDRRLARAALVQATQLQPRNAQPWLWLGEYDLSRRHLRTALSALATARSLDLGLQETRQAIAQGLTEQFAPPVLKPTSRSR
jgi:hypothetical protein